jgi:hypothetical protein
MMEKIIRIVEKKIILACVKFVRVALKARAAGVFNRVSQLCGGILCA